MKLTFWVAAIAFGMLWCGGCGDDSDAQVAQDKSDAAARPRAAGQNSTATTQPYPIAWLVPGGWEHVPGEKLMRVATFRRGVVNEEIVVSQFPGDAGGELANVNRWRQQIGLEPVTAAQLSAGMRPFDNGKLKGHTMRLRGAKQHMLAAIINDPAADRTWFVKAVTTPMAADTLEITFYAFAGSFGTGLYPAEWDYDAQRPSTRASTTAPK